MGGVGLGLENLTVESGKEAWGASTRYGWCSCAPILRDISRTDGDFGYDTELLTQDQVDEKALLNLLGAVRTSFTSLNGHSYQNRDDSAV